MLPSIKTDFSAKTPRNVNDSGDAVGWSEAGATSTRHSADDGKITRSRVVQWRVHAVRLVRSCTRGGTGDVGVVPDVELAWEGNATTLTGLRAELGDSTDGEGEGSGDGGSRCCEGVAGGVHGNANDPLCK